MSDQRKTEQPKPEQQKPIGIADQKRSDQEEPIEIADQPKTLDSNSPRTRNPAEQVKVWEEEGGSPPQQISSTRSVKPKTEPKSGAMNPAEG